MSYIERAAARTTDVARLAGLSLILPFCLGVYLAISSGDPGGLLLAFLGPITVLVVRTPLSKLLTFSPPGDGPISMAIIIVRIPFVLLALWWDLLFVRPIEWLGTRKGWLRPVAGSDLMPETRGPASPQSPNPLFEADGMSPNFAGDIALSSGWTNVGQIKKAFMSDDRVVLDASGQEVARIKTVIGDDRQWNIVGPGGEKLGHIERALMGDDLIVTDANGQSIGTFSSNWGGSGMHKA